MKNLTLIHGANGTTIEDLKAIVGNAGKCFIDRMGEEDYPERWLDAYRFDDEMHRCIILRMIRLYNDIIRSFKRTDDNKILDLASRNFHQIFGMLRFVREVNYYDVSKYGDITPFIDYCECCWKNHEEIDRNDYEHIRLFVATGSWFR